MSWYHLNDLGVQKNVPRKLFPIFCYFMEKVDEIVIEYFKHTNLIKRRKNASPKASNIKIFGHIHIT